MTPDAVIFRYLQTLLTQDIEVEGLCRLICADADLLQRWLKMFDLVTDAQELTIALKNLGEDDLRNLAHVQAWSLVPSAGSARLSLELWHGVLQSACLAESIYHALDPQASDAELANVRLRALLGLSGVQLHHDTQLMDLHRYRGIDPQLLEDASLELKIFTVVDAIETDGESALALSLLAIDEPAFNDLTYQAQTKAQSLISDLAIDDDETADWAHNIWLLQQISIAGQALSDCESMAELWMRHTSVSRSLFTTTPLILIFDEQQQSYSLLPEAQESLPSGSRSSSVAALGRSGGALVIEDSADLAVIDRQLLRKLDAEEALVVAVGPVIMLFNTDEDINVQLAADLYTREIARNIPADGAQTELEGDQNLLVEQFRVRESQRLREIVHEANNPLSIVRNYLHILDLSLGQDPETKDQLQLISSELRRASEIISQARDVPAALEGEQQEELDSADSTTTIDIAAWLRNLVTLHTGLAERSNVFLNVDAPDEPVNVTVDTGKLNQIVTNLVKNAIEASVPGGRVETQINSRLFRMGSFGVELTINDEAGGLPAEVLASLGENQRSSKGGEHQGVGLKVALELAQEIEAQLDVVTTTRGTLFRIFLPSPD